MAVFTWLYSLAGQGIARLFEVLFADHRLTGAIARGARKVTESGGHVERGMHGLLSVLNIPSKADYNRLLSKVEVLQGSLVNLNIKVDRLLAARERPRREPPDGQAGAESVSGTNP